MRKSIKKLIREALGVPQGIIEGSKELYEILMNEMSKIDPKSTEEEYETSIDVSLSIGDYTINTIKFGIKIGEFNIQTPQIASFGFGVSHGIELKKGLRMKHPISDEVILTTNIAVPEDNWSFKDITDLFIKNKDKIVRSLSHELKHSYDYYKKPKRSLYPAAMYQTYANTSLGLHPIDKFIHNLYFAHAIENLVRPSEVATAMEMKGVTQKNFLEFLKNDETYKQLSELSNFSVDKLKSDLKQYIPQINQILEGLDEPTDISDNEKIEKMLHIVYVTLVNLKGNTIRQMLQTELPEKLFNILNPAKEGFFERMINRIQRFNSYKEFFEYEEKMFKFISTKLMKKLGKLYAMARTDESSILDWDLHQKMNKNKMGGFTKESKYFKSKK